MFNSFYGEQKRNQRIHAGIDVRSHLARCSHCGPAISRLITVMVFVSELGQKQYIQTDAFGEAHVSYEHIPMTQLQPP